MWNKAIIRCEERAIRYEALADYAISQDGAARLALSRLENDLTVARSDADKAAEAVVKAKDDGKKSEADVAKLQRKADKLEADYQDVSVKAAEAADKATDAYKVAEAAVNKQRRAEATLAVVKAKADAYNAEAADKARTRVAGIDNMLLQAEAARGLGKTANAVRNNIGACMDYRLEGIVWDREALIETVSEWLKYTTLVGEARRTAKGVFQNSVARLSDKEAILKITERKRNGQTETGITVSYPAKETRKRQEYVKAVAAIAALVDKHGESAMYDAMALIMANNETTISEAADKGVEAIKAADKAIKAVEAEQAAKIAVMRQEMFAAFNA